MKYKSIDSFIALLFIGLLICTGYTQFDLKKEPQIYMLLFGILTLVSLFAKPPFRTGLPFFILLGVMCYISIFVLNIEIMNIINPEDGWITDSNGEKQRVMRMNWIWGVFLGLLLSPILVTLYQRRIKRNTSLEIAFTTVFILVTAIIYIKKYVFK